MTDEEALAERVIDQVQARLDSLDSLPVHEHVTVFETVHQELAAVLSVLDAPGQARSADPLGVVRKTVRAPGWGAYGWRDDSSDSEKETYTPLWLDVADSTPNWSARPRVPGPMRLNSSRQAGSVWQAPSPAKAATQVGVDQAIVVEQADDEPVCLPGRLQAHRGARRFRG